MRCERSRGRVYTLVLLFQQQGTGRVSRRHEQLSRREREIMEVIHRLRRASVADVHAALADPPSYSAVRATLRILEEKGVVRHAKEGRRYVFRATTSRTLVRERALMRLIKTFFDDSPEQAVAALLDRTKLSREELERIAKRIEEAKRKGR